MAPTRSSLEAQTTFFPLTTTKIYRRLLLFHAARTEHELLAIRDIMYEADERESADQSARGRYKIDRAEGGGGHNG